MKELLKKYGPQVFEIKRNFYYIPVCFTLRYDTSETDYSNPKSSWRRFPFMWLQ